MLRPAALLLLWLPATAAAEPPALRFPVACAMGRDCVIMQYFDQDPSGGYRDHACNFRSYDGHGGTDIAARDVGVMRRGVPVLAAADGVVAVVRDGLADAPPDPADPALRAVGCGNAVVLDHEDGWRTAYCHLRQGSVAVRPGESVAAGTMIGAIGMSGLAAFPHVEFQVLHRGKPVDPYTGGGSAGCGGPAARPLWTAEAAKTAAYSAIDLPVAAFADHPPGDDEMLNGLAALAAAPPRGPLFVAVQALGVRPGDRLSVVVRGPDGRIYGQAAVPFARNFIRVNAAVPLNRDTPWPPGLYRAEVTATRPDAGFSRSAVAVVTVR